MGDFILLCIAYSAFLHALHASVVPHLRPTRSLTVSYITPELVLYFGFPAVSFCCSHKESYNAVNLNLVQHGRTVSDETNRKNVCHTTVNGFC